jgi:hypothetical protein
LTPGNPPTRVHPARRTFVGIAVGITERTRPRDSTASDDREVGEVLARIAVYESRTSSEALVELPATYPAAGAFTPTLGTRYRLILEPIE